jgi:putative membrane protein
VNQDVYRRYQKDELILRDELAMDRTMLANERTLLAYVRTGLTLFIAGVSLLHFFESRVLFAVAWALVPAGVVTLLIGFARFRKVQRHIGMVRVAEPGEKPSS